MDETLRPQNEQSEPQHQEELSSTPDPTPQTPPRRCAFESLCNAVNKGASRARTTADRAAPNIKSAAESAAYWTAYGLSYASVFSWTLTKNLTPESAKSGFRTGVNAGKEAAQQWVDKLKQRKESAEPDSPNDSGVSTAEAQPNPA